MVTSQDQNKWVIIDNDKSDSATIIQVSSARRHEILFETIQTITNFSLILTKAYVSGEDGWFMDVFHVTDEYGQKIQDEGLIDQLCQALAAKRCLFNSANETVEVLPDQEYTMILLSGIDRPGLLYELSEYLAHHGVRIVNADLWTHKHHASAMVNVVDESTGSKISDSQKLSGIKKDLGHIIKPSVKFRSPEDWNVEDRSSRTRDTASNCSYRDYTRIDIRSDNRVNFLLDTISTLMVMQHVVFHGSVSVGKIKLLGILH
ncbi:ACT domain-containing protein ACR4-like isoform X2 [Chenopodium quinoa]|uniref:ACT domain-containing protein ACR4-like isoform X2 n=1 Tax=Chenopodium quinoa TaxID=63459 RepID=UPI000B76E79A|nr:ACT domain-containing protein ACR4-like isoform X2 [Chenopodium quinoa]